MNVASRVSLILAAAGFAAPVQAQVVSALVREGDAIGGSTVTSILNPDVNSVGGWAVGLGNADSLSRFYGTVAGGPPAVLRTEGVIGGYTQTGFESFWGFSDSGSIAYSPTLTGAPVAAADSVWVDDTPIAVAGTPAPIAGQFWSFGSRPAITADGIPYFVGGTTGTVGGSTNNRGLFYGNPLAKVFAGGDALPGLPGPLSATATNPSFDYRFSRLGTHHIGEVIMTGQTTATDTAMVVDAAGLLIDGALVREGSPVPVAAGGQGGENWIAFGFVGIAESGSYMLRADTSGPTTSDEILVRDGAVVIREGASVGGGLTVSGAMGQGYMNEDGDWAVVWITTDGVTPRETLLVNGQVVVRVSAEVDLDGDGVVEPGHTLSDIMGTAAVVMTDRDGSGQVKVYFVANVDTLGTPSTTDDTGALMVVTVQAGTGCYANCDGSTTPPILNVLDFSCFLNEFAAGATYANCDDSTTPPVLNVLDFSCFLNEFAAGCP